MHMIGCEQGSGCLQARTSHAEDLSACVCVCSSVPRRYLPHVVVAYVLTCIGGLVFRAFSLLLRGMIMTSRLGSP